MFDGGAVEKGGKERDESESSASSDRGRHSARGSKRKNAASSRGGSKRGKTESVSKDKNKPRRTKPPRTLKFRTWGCTPARHSMLHCRATIMTAGASVSDRERESVCVCVRMRVCVCVRVCVRVFVSGHAPEAISLQSGARSVSSDVPGQVELEANPSRILWLLRNE